MRLNLGGRDRPIPGFKTVDLYEGSDIQTDVSNLAMFDSESVAEIYASHILEHFPHPKTEAVLREWYRVLKFGAKIYIALPDFDAMMTSYQRYGLSDWLRNFMFGDQDHPLAFHYSGFNFMTLSRLLRQVGFHHVVRHELFPHRVSDCSTLVDTIERKSVSLNVEAIK